jgi:signal transduction histidine kinase
MRSISLRTQLLFTIVGSIAATAVALTTLAYRVQVTNLERDAHRAVRVASQSRAEAVARVIDGQQQRAQRFLITAASLCGEERQSGGIAWELECTRRALQELRASERASGAALTSRGRRIARSGVAPRADLPIPTPLARLVEENGRPAYVIQSANRDASVRLLFPIEDLEGLFDQPLGFGTRAEVFLRADAGTPLTPSRAGVPADATALIESSHSCVLGATEWVGIDDHGIETIHGMHPVSSFAQPLCVEAHVSRAEAVAPAGTLLVDLLRQAVIFSLVGAVLVLAASHWMTASLQRLAASARALAEGDFTKQIPTAGPSEVRSLARTFAAMRRALQEQMQREQRARHEAETANRAKDEFLAILSHELRTPLASMLGWARLLRLGNLERPKADRAIAAIERSAQMQQRLVDDLLDVSRIIAGRLHLDRTAVQLSDSIRAAIDELRPIAEEKGVALDISLESVPSVAADTVRIQQIVTNLLTNAIKFTPSGGAVSVALREREERAEIVISDTGIGISSDFLPHIFEPFRQADAGPRFGYRGLGLGLSIVQHLVKLHGGTIEATSGGLGMGSRFTVRLPLAGGDLAARTAPPPQHAASDAGAQPLGALIPRLDTLRLLVVDDDEETRRLVGALLEEAGARVDLAATAAEGRQRLQDERYSAIISDLVMPQEDGYAFVRALRAAKATIPALALSALVRQEDAAAAYDAGFQGFLTKPVNRDELIAAVASLTKPAH